MILHDKTNEFGYTFDEACGHYCTCIKCDYCGVEFNRKKCKIIRGRTILMKDCCNKQVCINLKIKESSMLKYGTENPSQSKEIIQKTKESNLIKYGVENTAQLDSSKDKAKQTCLKKYGNKCYSLTEEYKQKCKETSLIHYGVDHPMKSDEIKDKITYTHSLKTSEEKENIKKKIRKTNLERFGVDHPMKSDEIKDKARKTNFDKYGFETYLKTDECIVFREKACLEKYGVKNVIYLFVDKAYGKTENKIKEFLKTLGFDFIKDRNVLDGKEIDLYSEKMKFGIEYCGNYHHNDKSKSPKDKTYHYFKYKESKKQGIQLITMFEDEWLLRNKQCKNFIKSILGKFERRIYARKCVIKEVDKSNYNLFVNDNHILGMHKGTKVRYGLFYNDELLGAISLSRHHRQNVDKNILLLDRLCFKDGVQVIGGASKLFKQCLNWAKNNNYKKITSFSDNRWSAGKIYKILGFTLEKNYRPDYSYIDLNRKCKRLTKQSQQKKKINCPKEITEEQWQLERGLAKMWDCGKKRWVYDITGNP